jgi:tetratricopeptide (TPR) repeat protein
MVLMIPALALGLYNQWGYLDDVEMMPLYERTVSNFENPEEAQALIVALGQEVQANENQPWAWYFLAENFANIGMFNEAEISYARSASLLEDTFEKAVVLGRVAMTKYINSELQFTPEVQRVVNEAREINPNEVTILQLLASNASANENFAEAIGYWRLLIQANPNSEQAESLRLNITSAQNLMAEQELSGDNNPIINVVLALREGLELNRNLRVFVAARDANQEGLPPLAAIDLTVANLPTTIRLDNSSAVGPFNLASANEIYVSALVSQSGTATPQVGDYRVVSEQFSHNNESNQLDLIISERVD